MAFNPNDHLSKLPGKNGDYLEVKWRLVWFRELCPQGTIDTEELAYDTEKECTAESFVWNDEKRRKEKVMKTDKGYARYRAVVTDGKGGRATGTKAECKASFEDYGEKAETGAIGRALAALGYGTQFAPELEEGDRIVDSPVERKVATRPMNGHKPAPVTEPQELASPVPDDAPTPQELRRRFNVYKATGVTKATYEEFLAYVFGRATTDEDLTPAYCLVVEKMLGAYEKKAKAS